MIRKTVLMFGFVGLILLFATAVAAKEKDHDEKHRTVTSVVQRRPHPTSVPSSTTLSTTTTTNTSVPRDVPPITVYYVPPPLPSTYPAETFTTTTTTTVAVLPIRTVAKSVPRLATADIAIMCLLGVVAIASFAAAAYLVRGRT